MGIQCYWPWDRKRRTTVESQRQFQHGDNNTSSGNRRKRRRSNGRIDEYVRLFGYGQCRKFHHIKSWRSISIYPKLFWAWDDKSNNNTESNNYKKRHRHNKHLYAIGASLLSLVNPTVALAENVGGVSATANPIANSSGSVTNQAIQVLQGPYVTNTYGNQISCQGPTFNATPYIQFSDSRKDPWEDFYNEPQYDARDFTGRTIEQTVTVKNYPWEDWYDDRVDADGDRWFEDGDDMDITVEVDSPDGVPDYLSNGQLPVLWEKPVRIDPRANQNFNVGLSATLSWPMDKQLQKLCKTAAQTQIEQQQQLTANKRLDFEIARLKNCGELMQKGIMFHPKSPYAAICADVVVVNPGGKLPPHSHNIPQPTFSKPSATPSPLDSSRVVPTSSPSGTVRAPSSQEETSLYQSLSSPQASPPSEEGQPAALLGGPMSLRLPQYQP